MPFWQFGQVPSLKANGEMTRSPLRSVRHVGADVLDHADELVADRPGLERGVAAVVPEIRSADARQHDAHDRVGGLSDRGVRPVAGRDVAGFVEDRSAHWLTPPQFAFDSVTSSP